VIPPDVLLKNAKRRRPLTLLQERFIESGFEGFQDEEVLELFLSVVIQHRRCKKAIKVCIERFKNLRRLLAASTEELERVGFTPECIYTIKFLGKLPAEILKQRIIEQPINSTSRGVFDYLMCSMRDLKKEVFKVVYLNTRHQIFGVADLFKGSVKEVLISPREIIENTIKSNATALIFAHNHPSGDPNPSRSDKQLTRDLVFMGMILQIEVLDHIIIGGNQYFSFADEGLIKKYENHFLNLKIRGVSEVKRRLYQAKLFAPETY